MPKGKEEATIYMGEGGSHTFEKYHNGWVNLLYYSFVSLIAEIRYIYFRMNEIGRACASFQKIK